MKKLLPPSRCSAMSADVELYGIVDTGIGDQHVD